MTSRIPPNLPMALYPRFYKGGRVTSLVLSISSVQKYSPDVPHIVVSITNPFAPEDYIADLQRDDDPRIGYVTDLPQFPDNPLRAGVLRLQFHDADQADEELDIRLMTEQHAEDTWNFVEKHLPNIELVLVHCHGGLCRSPGAAAAISRVVNGDDQFFFDTFWPNRHVYRTLLNAPGAARLLDASV